MQIGLDSLVVPLLCLLHSHSCLQLSDIAKGLCYLHSCNVIHGNLKGVRGCFERRFPTMLTPASQTSLWTTPVVHASRTLASLRSLRVSIPSGTLGLNAASPHGGLRQRS